MTNMLKRNTELREILTKRRSYFQGEAQSRIREWRAGRPDEGRDGLEDSDADNHGDMEFALAQMRGETLARIDEALARLDVGRYGFCFECDDEIAERRLRALPFAVRCQACEQKREQTQETSHVGSRRSNHALVPDLLES